MSTKSNLWFELHKECKDLEISDFLEDAKSIDRKYVDWSKGRSIDILAVQIVDRSKCLGRFSIFSGSVSNSESDQNALDVFPGLIQEFWIRFQLRPENKIKHKNYNKTLYIHYELGLTNANKWVLNQTIQDLSSPLFIGFKRPQKLLKIGLCLSSVRTEVSLVQTVFCDILSKTA